MLTRAPYDGWTTDDLDAIPVDGVRRELIDGVLFVTPALSLSHQHVLWRLCTTLNRLRPPRFAVRLGCEVRAGRQRSFVPEAVVITAEAKQRDPAWVRPEEVVLAVEVVSPATLSIDRVLKPSLYAQIGIGGFWRIEPTEDFRLHAYCLGPRGVYVEAGEFDDAVAVEQPWPMEFGLAAMKPE